MDKSKYSQAAFKSKKSVEANAIRLCYEIRAFTAQSLKPTKSLSKYIERMLQILGGDHKLNKQEGYKSKISGVFIEDDILIYTLSNISMLSLDFCRDLFTIFFLCLDPSFEEYIVSNIDTISDLLITPISLLDLDLLSGQFLRDLMQDKRIYKALLSTKVYKMLTDLACSQIFELSSDACASIRALIDCPHASHFINRNYCDILTGLYQLCRKDYYSQRIALNILYNILSNPKNSSFAEQYAEKEDNLKYVMNLMKIEKSVEIKIEAFYLFSLLARIIYNLPNRNELASYKIILKNHGKIIEFFNKFQVYREDDKFHKEKKEIIGILMEFY
jgi:Mo25-like